MEAPTSDDYQPGMLSIVTDQAGGRTRRLPTLYVDTVSVFSHRELDVINEATKHFIHVLSGTSAAATYRLNAIRVEGRWGLYGRDFFNRSPFRLRLQRLGYEFALDPYVKLRGDGLFECADWDPFPATFVVLSGEPEEADSSVVSPGALAFTLSSEYRVGDLLSKNELSTLARAISGTLGLRAADPQALTRALDRKF